MQLGRALRFIFLLALRSPFTIFDKFYTYLREKFHPDNSDSTRMHLVSIVPRRQNGEWR